MNSSRIHRLLRVIALLQSGPGRSADSLALECRVTRRTIFRDLAALREAGLGLLYDEDARRYHLPIGQVVPLTGFTEMEALAVLALCNENLGSWTFPFQHALRSAALKFEHSLTARVRRRLKDLVRTLDAVPVERSLLPGASAIHENLVLAVADRQAVRITYHSIAERQTIQTKLWPFKLFHARHTWYVIGRSSLHRSIRTFHIGRIERLDVLDEKFHIPRGFSLNRHFGNAWRMIPDSGPDHDVHIRFAPRVAPNVSQVRWHRTQRVKFDADGSLDFYARVSGLEEIAWWIIGYGDQAEVLAPPQLRELIAFQVRNLVAKYEAGHPRQDEGPMPQRVPPPHFSRRRAGLRKRPL